MVLLAVGTASGFSISKLYPAHGASTTCTVPGYDRIVAILNLKCFIFLRLLKLRKNEYLYVKPRKNEYLYGETQVADHVLKIFFERLDTRVRKE